MPRNSNALATLPPHASSALETLGSDLATARLRRHESLRSWAQRLNVSVPTLVRMEKGDPTVSAGVYATALWIIGRTSALAGLAAPADDLNALELDVRAALGRGRRSHPVIKATPGR